jgi:hypothetical protein
VIAGTAVGLGKKRRGQAKSRAEREEAREFFHRSRFTAASAAARQDGEEADVGVIVA